MQVNIVKSSYENIHDIKDVPESFVTDANPLYIGAREGQVKRVRSLLGKNRTDDAGFAVGTWELGTYGFLTSDGKLDVSVWKKHSVVYATEPERVPEKFRPAYEKLLWELKAL